MSTSTTQKASKRRKGKIPNIDKSLRKLVDLLKNNEVSGFKCRPKNIKGCFKNNSNRRSKYIGVSRNGNSWQVLINVKNQKKYIGGFTNEIRAAMAYDFYTMALRGADAKTNFDYDNELVLEMVNNYFAMDNQFDPSLYESRVKVL